MLFGIFNFFSHFCLRKKKKFLLLLGEENCFIIVNAHEVYVCILRFFNDLISFISISLLQGRSDLLIKTSLFSLIPQISLPDLRRVSSEVRILNLGSWWVFSRRISFRYSKSLHHSFHFSGQRIQFRIGIRCGRFLFNCDPLL
jgi:hypothetical protein